MKTIKYFLLLVSSLFCLPLLAQTHEENQIAEVAHLYKAGEYNSSLNLLKQIKKGTSIDYLLSVYEVRNLYQLLIDADDYSFETIAKLRYLTDDYPARFKSERANHFKDEMSSTLKQLNTNYPLDEQSYLALIEKRNQERITIQRNALINNISDLYSRAAYVQVLQNVKKAQDVDLYNETIMYYEILAKNQLFKNDFTHSFAEISEVRELAGNYLNNHAHLNTEFSLEIAKIRTTLPSTLDEYKVQVADEKARKEEARLNARIQEIQSKYNKGLYYAVLSEHDVFGQSVPQAMSYAYYRSMAYYKKLQLDSFFTFEDVTIARTALQAYLGRYGKDSVSYKNDVEYALLTLNIDYPKTRASYDAIKRKEKRVLDRGFRKLHRKMFVSIGYEYGSIAPYGLRFEVGGRYVGFFTILRSSIANEDKIWDGYVNSGGSPPDKNELIIGPNIKIAKWFFINIGAGYGYYSHVFRNDYLQDAGIKKTNYLSGYLGTTIRMGNFVNLVGGASFMDVNKKIANKITKPEYTVGMTFNLK